MKLISLVLAVTLALSNTVIANSAFAQTDSGDLKSVGESNPQSESGDAGSMNSLWSEEKTAPEAGTTVNPNSNARSGKSKSKSKKSKRDRYNVAPSDAAANTAPIDIPAAEPAGESTVMQGSPVQNDSAANREPATKFVQPVSTAAGAETTITDVGGLCSMNAFQSSELLSRSAWPGLGPFTSGGENQYSDANDNKIKVFLDGDHVSACELLLSNSGVANQSFLNLEMICDFMLEALGAKGSKIAEFNSYIEKNKDGMSGATAAKKTENQKPAKVTERAAFRTSTGAYQIALLPAGTGPGTLLVQVTSKNGSIGKSESLINTKGSQDTQVSSDPSPEIQATDDSVSSPVKSTVKTASAISNRNTLVRNNTTSKTAPGPKTSASTASASTSTEVKTDQGEDELKNELREVIRNWQTVKKAAVKSRDTSTLSTVLAGNALKRQSDSIKWLVDNKQYYELTPKSVVVERYEELSKSPRKYAVFTIVKELTRVMKDGQSGAAKETDDTYSVKYTIERTGDHWSIADSLLLVKKK